MMNELKNNNTYSSILSALNEIPAEWSNQFDSPDKLALAFDVNESGLLTVNGKTLLYAPVELVDTESIYVDVEWVGFSVRNGCSYDFKVEWLSGRSAHPHVTRLRLNVPMEHIA